MSNRIIIVTSTTKLKDKKKKIIKKQECMNNSEINIRFQILTFPLPLKEYILRTNSYTIPILG